MLKTVSSITNALGALNYKGTWNASTNSPALSSGAGTKGDYYVVSVAGTTSLDGISNWGVGDWATFNGSVWQRVEGGADLNGVNLSISGLATFGSNIQVAQGVTFPAIQFDSSDANTLDDYEQGTCTFTITNGITSPTYDLQTGWYTKIGNTVFINGRVTLTGGTTTGNGLVISGLPFTVYSLPNVFSVGTSYCAGVAIVPSNVLPLPIQGGTTIEFYTQSTTTITPVTGTNFGSTGSINFQFSYRVA